jgi:hypothetical protein
MIEAQERIEPRKRIKSDELKIIADFRVDECTPQQIKEAYRAS